MLGVNSMARVRPDPLAAARDVLAPLLAVVGVLAGLLLGPAGLSSVARPTVAAPAFAGSLAPAQDAAFLRVLVALVTSMPSRGPAMTSVGMPATIARGPLGLRDEAGRLFDDGSSRQDESLTSRRLGPRPQQVAKSHQRSFGDGPAGPPHAAGSPLFPGVSPSRAAGGKLRAHDPRKKPHSKLIDRVAHAPRGPPSKLSV